MRSTERRIKESATLKLNALVTQMKAEGVDVVNLTAGEPDFPAPEEAKQAVIAARQKIVLGAVSMVEMALQELARKEVVALDEERKAAMVSNLLVVLCGTEEAAPVINTGTLYT